MSLKQAHVMQEAMPKNRTMKKSIRICKNAKIGQKYGAPWQSQNKRGAPLKTKEHRILEQKQKKTRDYSTPKKQQTRVKYISNKPINHLITFGTRLYQLYLARDWDWREVGVCRRLRGRRRGCWRWSSKMPFGGKVVHTLRKVVFDFEDLWFKTFRVITILNGVFGGRRTFVFRRCCSLLF